MHSKVTVTLVLLIGVPCGSALAGNDAAIRFNRDIRPIFTENCFACHGPDPGGRKEGLRFDRAEGFFTERKDGTPIVKGDPQKSLVFQRITSSDSDEIMPPAKTHKTLTAKEKDLIKRWIEQGAPWEPHWSWIVPVKATPPSVKNSAWVRNPIDQFILAKLEARGLTPAPEADRRTLIRRLTFDLIGLPPTPEEIAAFLGDRSDGAYERVVDRLLASPRYGEHHARYWLDGARYADTHGLHFDNYREMWPYRDWVIHAYNANMHFDQFLTEQLAGDLLPNATLDQQIASGFMRCNETTNEGGTIAEENLVNYARDRTETVGRLCLGLTVGCAVCHDHKFDPILQKDFYALSAFLSNGTSGALDGNVKDSPPSVVVPRDDDRPRWRQLMADFDALHNQLEQREKSGHADFEQWLASADPGQIWKKIPQRDMQLLAPLNEGAGDVTHATINSQPRDIALVPQMPDPAAQKLPPSTQPGEINPPSQTVAHAPQPAWMAGEVMPKALETQRGVAPTITDVGDFDGHTPFSCAVWAKLPTHIANGSGSIVARMTDVDNHRGWDMWVQENHIGGHIIHHWSDDALKVLTKKAVDPGKWHHFCITYDGKGKAKGYHIYVDGEPQQTQVEFDDLKGSAHTTVPFKVGQRDHENSIVGLLVQDLRIYTRALSPTDVVQLARVAKMSEIVSKAPAARSEKEKTDLYGWWLQTLDPQSMALESQVDVLDKKKKEIEARGGECLVMQEKPTPPVAYVLYRGDYAQRREKLEAMTPASLPPFPSSAPRNRLGLAQWMVEPENPLTARVAVNRLWQELFGTGIVKTSEDFGIMGDAPSNQELLDWLAVDFRESHWDIKRMLKMMVMSAAYRQAATETPEKIEIDPDNRLLAQAHDTEWMAKCSAMRLWQPAVCSRRQWAGRVSGRISRAISGMLSECRAVTRGIIARTTATTSIGAASIPSGNVRPAPPSMEIFNAPTRETCTVRRDRTDTPLQALVTMNDTQFVEAARVLAQNAIVAGGKTFDSRLDFVTERILARPFRTEEIAIARSEYDDLLAYYRAHHDEAINLLHVGEAAPNPSLDQAEHAAWTMLANQVMNLDEALNK